jgi:hypothetical protein
MHHISQIKLKALLARLKTIFNTKINHVVTTNMHTSIRSTTKIRVRVVKRVRRIEKAAIRRNRTITKVVQKVDSLETRKRKDTGKSVIRLNQQRVRSREAKASLKISRTRNTKTTSIKAGVIKMTKCVVN